MLTGFDNRISTSKTIALMWTPVVAYIISTLAYVAIGRRSYGLWEALVGSPVGFYLIVLGGPFAAAVGAKSVVSTGVASGRIQKPSAKDPKLADLFSDDHGDVDVVDTQYLFFNVVAIVIVLAQFIDRPGFGAPQIPGFLAALTGASAATYLTNKALQTGGPVISSVAPLQARIGQAVRIFGTSLYAPASADAHTAVTVGGNAATDIAPTASYVEFRVPPPGTGAYASTPQQVVLTTVAGIVATSPDGLSVSLENPMPSSVSPRYVWATDRITVHGRNLYTASALDFAGHPVDDNSNPQISLVPIGGGNPISCPRTTPPTGMDTDSQATVIIPAGTQAGRYVIEAQGRQNLNVVLEVVQPAITGAAPDPVQQGGPLTVSGSHLFSANSLNASGVPAPGADLSIQLVPAAAGGNTVACPRATPHAVTDSASQVTVTVPVGTALGTYTVTTANLAPGPAVTVRVT